MVMGFTRAQAAQYPTWSGQLYASQEAKLYMCKEVLTGKLHVLHFNS